MWVFTKQGLFSVTASENSPGLFVVQSRFADHIEHFFPDAEVMKKPYGVLRFRAAIPRWLVYQKLVSTAEEIDYSDLGVAIPDPHYQNACRDVLTTLGKHAPALPRKKTAAKDSRRRGKNL